MAPSSPQATIITCALAFAGVILGLNYSNFLPHKVMTDNLGKQGKFPVDVIILGGSHAGLSAAATLYRHQHTMIIFDNKNPRNLWRTGTRATSGWEGQDPEKLREKSRKEIHATGFASLMHKSIVSITKTNDSLFLATDTEGESWYGRKLLLAMGAEFIFPEIPGYVENFPNKM